MILCAKYQNDTTNGSDKKNYYKKIITDAYFYELYCACVEMNIKNSVWKFPESAQVIDTLYSNIIISKFPVKYKYISISKCIIETNIILKIEYAFQEYLTNL